MQLFYLQATILMCFTSTCSSIFYSTADNPKWLKFTELRHGKFVYEDLSWQISMLSVKALLRNIWQFFWFSPDLPFITVETSSWWKKWLIILHINLLWLLGNILWWLLFLDIFWTSLPSMFTSPSFLSLFSSLPSLFLRFIVSIVLSRSFSSMLRNFPLNFDSVFFSFLRFGWFFWGRCIYLSWCLYLIFGGSWVDVITL